MFISIVMGISAGTSILTSVLAKAAVTSTCYSSGSHYATNHHSTCDSLCHLQEVRTTEEIIARQRYKAVISRVLHDIE